MNVGLSRLDSPRQPMNLQFTSDSGETVQKMLPDPAAKFKKKNDADAKAAGTVKEAEESMPAQFNTQALWPVGFVAVPAGLFALSKVDPGTAKLFESGWVKVCAFGDFCTTT
jgi:hypothetical protein